MPHTPRFTLSGDGTSLAYRLHGDAPDGASTIVFSNGFATSDFYWAHIIERLSGTVGLVTWDLKGHGRSGPAHDLSACTIPDSVDDVRRIMDAAGIETAVLAGFSLGCQLIFEAWRQMPERIEGLIPILGTYGRPFDSLVDPRLGHAVHQMASAIGTDWGPVIVDLTRLSMRSPLAHPLNQLFGMIGSRVSRRQMAPFYDHFDNIDGETFMAMGLAAQEHSAEDVLETIDVPTLIIAGGKDLLTPQHLSLEMRERIRGAEFLMLPHATHAGLFEYPTRISKRIEDFLYDHGFIGTRSIGRESA